MKPKILKVGEVIRDKDGEVVRVCGWHMDYKDADESYSIEELEEIARQGVVG